MNRLTSDVRNSVGKNDSHHLRDEGYIPAVIYSKDMDTLPIRINRREAEGYIRRYGENSLVDLSIGGTSYTALIKEIQADPLTRSIIHIDFQRVTEDQKIHVKIPIILQGRQLADGGSAILQQQINDIEIECSAGSIPKKLEMNISNFRPGDILRVADLEISEEFHIVQDPQTIIASLSIPDHVAEEEEKE
ncbi:50S ribosomal protein L25 [Alkaliphilus serpentinus]|uniref:Large ribosomal subunit protein bL25 n=1 Tax=Alkaliphilus serpentinus TaxID=1482731 RepID=A0A833MER5_9FIRM|nr:50S ribosomal protein L25 [Alkaliphilus serpentinus]KAB3531794.1 50S ribosomal protein L25 [Alkaliphilus serpentinus]